MGRTKACKMKGTAMARKEKTRKLATNDPTANPPDSGDLMRGLGSAMAAFTEAQRLLVNGKGDPVVEDSAEWVNAFAADSEKLNDADFSSLISRLNAQATLLELMFVKMARLSMSSTGLAQTVQLGGLAMRIQSNLRATAQTICDLKHPRQQVNFIRSDVAAVTTGPQQVNNTTAMGITATHVDSDNQRNRQSEGNQIELYQDTGTPSYAVRDDSAMEAMGEKHRTDDGSR